MNKLLVDIGNRINNRRRAMGYTQEQVADMMDVSIQMVSNLERGNKAIRIDNLLKLCQILQVSTDYILTGEQSENELSKKISKLSKRDYQLVCRLVDFCEENREKYEDKE